MRSFGFAFRGILTFIKSHHNFAVQLFFGILVVIGGWFFRISSGEWIAVVICSCMVLAAEIFNTSIEILTDRLFLQIHPEAKAIKDMSAGAVLVIAVGASICGGIIFVPKIVQAFMHHFD